MAGKLIAIEGIDGSGKNTQTQLLHEHLKKIGYEVKKLSFPMYESHFFGKEVGVYLNGGFGSLDQVDPKLAAMLYAGDRYEAKDLILSSLARDEIILCDRYVSSNVAHQSAKVIEFNKKEELQCWIEELEYEIYGLPLADLTIFLDVPPSISSNLVDKKEKRSYTEKVKDLHEEDQLYLGRVYDIFKLLACSRGWLVIDCIFNGELKDMDVIAKEVMNIVDNRL